MRQRHNSFKKIKSKLNKIEIFEHAELERRVD